MRSVMSHEARQVPSWLIFDVSQNMDFSSLQNLLCGVGIGLIAYSRTFPRWLRERAMERYLNLRETIAVMREKLKQYDKVQAILIELEKEADGQGVFASKKEELEFK